MKRCRHLVRLTPRRTRKGLTVSGYVPSEVKYAALAANKAGTSAGDPLRSTSSSAYAARCVGWLFKAST